MCLCLIFINAISFQTFIEEAWLLSLQFSLQCELQFSQESSNIRTLPRCYLDYQWRVGAQVFFLGVQSKCLVCCQTETPYVLTNHSSQFVFVIGCDMIRVRRCVRYDDNRDY